MQEAASAWRTERNVEYARTGERPPADHPIVSVILPAKNRADIVGTAIKSVLTQRFLNFELLLIDDHSEDDTLKVLRSWADKDARLHVLQSERRGVSAARNTGLLAARGELIAYLDSDNTWRDNHLEEVVKAIRHRACACCYTWMKVRVEGENGKTIQAKTVKNHFNSALMLRRNLIDLNAFAHTTELYWSAGGFDETMSRLVDWDLITRMTDVSPPVEIKTTTVDYVHGLRRDRISLTQDFVTNRTRFALKHRKKPSDSNNLTFGCVGLVAKDVSAIGFDGLMPALNLDIESLSSLHRLPEFLLWRWSRTHEKAMIALSERVAFECTLSICIVPLGSHPGLFDDPSTRTLFDIYVGANPEEAQRLHELWKKPEDVNPIKTCIPLDAGTPSEYSLRSLFAEVRAEIYPRKDLKLRIDCGSTDQTARTKHQFEALGYQTTAEDPDVEILGPNSPDHASNALRVGWIRGGEQPSIEFLSAMDIVLVDNNMQGKMLRANYPGLRLEILTGSLHEQTLSVLRAIRYWRTPMVDGRPRFKRLRVLWTHGNRGAGATRKRVFEIKSGTESVLESRAIPHREYDFRDAVGSDLIIHQRALDTEAPDKFLSSMSLLQPLGKVFAYEIDDFVFRESVTAMSIIKQADVLFTSTPPLAEDLRRENKPVFILRNAEDAERLLPVQPATIDNSAHQLVLASTSAHGLEQLRELLPMRVAGKPVHVHVFAQFSELPADEEGISCHERVPITELFSYFQAADLIINSAERSALLSEVSTVGDESFDRYVEGKSELKFQMAGLAKTPLVSSRRPSIYAQLIQHGENGWLADSVEELRAVITEALAAPELRAAVAEKAYEQVMKSHTIARAWPVWAAGLEAAAECRWGQQQRRAYDDPYWEQVVWPKVQIRTEPPKPKPKATTRPLHSRIKIAIRTAMPPAIWRRIRSVRRTLRPLEERLRDRLR